MSNIHPTNIIADSAKIGKNVNIGAYNVIEDNVIIGDNVTICLLYTSPSPRDGLLSRMPSSA